MTIRQQGGIFGRNPTFNNVGVTGALTGLSDLSISGNLIVASGKGIDFSATSGTGTSELFSDYEEGTWTATYGADTDTGIYTKIGRLVYVDVLLSKNSASFSSITGLPFTAASGGYSGVFTWGRVARMDVLDLTTPCRISVSGTTINFTTNVTTGADAAFTVTSDALGAVRAGLSGVYYV